MEVVAIATKQILVIEDEPNLREVMRACLRDLGGWEVLEAFSTGRIDRGSSSATGCNYSGFDDAKNGWFYFPTGTSEESGNPIYSSCGADC